MIRYYVCTLTLAVPDEGLPAITASAWRAAVRREAGTEPEPAAEPEPAGSKGGANGAAPDPDRPLTEEERAFLVRLAGRCGPTGEHWLPAIEQAATWADGKQLQRGLKGVLADQEGE